MPAFTPEAIVWSNPDVRATLRQQGLLTVLESAEDELRGRLHEKNYVIEEIDFEKPFVEVRQQIGALFRWEEQFGYRYEDSEGNLDALQDGFCLPAELGGRTALLLRNVDGANLRDGWVEGFLSIASEHSQYQLALGARFFTVLVVGEKSGIVGRSIRDVTVPHVQGRLFEHRPR